MRQRKWEKPGSKAALYIYIYIYIYRLWTGRQMSISINQSIYPLARSDHCALYAASCSSALVSDIFMYVGRIYTSRNVWTYIYTREILRVLMKPWSFLHSFHILMYSPDFLCFPAYSLGILLYWPDLLWSPVILKSCCLTCCDPLYVTLKSCCTVLLLGSFSCNIQSPALPALLCSVLVPDMLKSCCLLACLAGVPPTYIIVILLYRSSLLMIPCQCFRKTSCCALLPYQ
jgi:hypothetical protein